MPQRKAALRERIAKALALISPLDRVALSAQAQARLIETPEWIAARTVMLYHSDETEVETHDLVLAALHTGKRVGLPRTEKGARTMTVLEILDVKRDLEVSRFGFKEPRKRLLTIEPEEIDLVVVPGRAFDRHGTRLGRGAGYYDRFIAKHKLRAVTIGLAYDLQIVDEVPRQPHDRKIDLIVTESRVVRP